MIEVAGEPFIAHQLRLLHREGVPRVVLCVGYLGEQIEAFVKDGSQFGIAVDYCYDGPNLLGTGGALRKALPQLGPEFLVMYGDSWLDTPLPPIVDAFRNSGKPALMTVFRNDGPMGRQQCLVRGRQHPPLRQARTTAANAAHRLGFDGHEGRLVEKRPPDIAFDLSDLYSDLSRRGELAGYEVTTRFYEIGSIDGLRETEELLRKQSDGRFQNHSV